MFNGIIYIDFKYRTGKTCQEEDKLRCSVGLILFWKDNISFVVAKTSNKS